MPTVRRFVPLHESVEKTLMDALGVPGLTHLKSDVKVCEGDDKISALISFRAAGVPTGVSLSVCADNSFILIEDRPGDKPWSQTWTAEEADPDVITGAVVAALRRRVGSVVTA